MEESRFDNGEAPSEDRPTNQSGVPCDVMGIDKVRRQVPVSLRSTDTYAVLYARTNAREPPCEKAAAPLTRLGSYGRAYWPPGTPGSLAVVLPQLPQACR